MALQTQFGGKEGVRGFAKATFAAIPDFRWTPTIILIDGARASSEWRMTGTQTGDFPGIPATGKSFSVPGASVLEIRARQDLPKPRLLESRDLSRPDGADAQG